MRIPASTHRSLKGPLSRSRRFCQSCPIQRPIPVDYCSRARGDRCSATSGGRTGFNVLTNDARRKEAGGIGFPSISRDLSYRRGFEILGDTPFPSPSPPEFNRRSRQFCTPFSTTYFTILSFLVCPTSWKPWRKRDRGPFARIWPFLPRQYFTQYCVEMAGERDNARTVRRPIEPSTT